MKKILPVLIFSLIASQVSHAAFNDVSAGHANVNAIEYLQSEGVIGGYSDGSFRPGAEINRAEMMKILVEGQGISPSLDEYNNCFPDVSTEWFAPYVCYAKANDWVGGYPDGNFKPAQNVLNIEALKMILNAKNVALDSNYETQYFSNVNNSEWFYPFIVTAEKLNLIDPLTPGVNHTRGDVSEVIFRSIAIENADASSYSAALGESLRNPNANTQTTETEEEVMEKMVLEAPAYEAYTPEKLAEYKGNQPFVLFFHASWCPICRRIEDDLKANLDSYPDGLVILEADYDDETELRKEYKVTRQYFFVMFDEDGEVTFSNNLFSADDVVEEASKNL